MVSLSEIKDAVIPWSISVLVLTVELMDYIFSLVKNLRGMVSFLWKSLYTLGKIEMNKKDSNLDVNNPVNINEINRNLPSAPPPPYSSMAPTSRSLSTPTGMNRYLSTLNRLQDIFTQCGVSLTDINLPQIAVVGCQSAGKSSVLESIAQQDLLPRGTGIVTRRPLVLQMIHEVEPLIAGDEVHHTWAFFLHQDNRCYCDMEQVQQEIIRDTEQVCGANKMISEKPIRLRLHSTRVPSLTLIDLPGLTRIAVENQPESIVQQIEALVRSYVETPNTIVLAISPGNHDIANSDSIRLAREVDPDGERTLSVVTKVDLMERSTESLELLQGVSVNIKLGQIGVVNRNSDMLQNKVSIKEALLFEEKFFASNFPSLAPIMGTGYLSTRLCDLLIEKLRTSLPEVEERINNQLQYHRNILTELGPETSDKKMEMITLVGRFVDTLRKSIQGEYTFEYKNASTNTKSKDSRTAREITKVSSKPPKQISVGSELLNTVQSKLTDLAQIQIKSTINTIREEIKSATGIQPSLFVPDAAFNSLVYSQLELFDAPLLNIMDTAEKCIGRYVARITELIMKPFPQLQNEVTAITRNHLQSKVPDLKDFVKKYLEVQRSYINTNHPDFSERFQVANLVFRDELSDEEMALTQGNGRPIKKSQEAQLAELMGRYKETSLLEESRKDKEVTVMFNLITLYFSIIRNSILDMTPKIIMKFLVTDLMDDLGSMIITKLLSEDLERILMESPEITRKRSYSKKMVDTLTQAANVLSTIESNTEL